MIYKIAFASLMAFTVPASADGLEITESNLDEICDAFASGVSNVLELEPAEQQAYVKRQMHVARESVIRDDADVISTVSHLTSAFQMHSQAQSNPGLSGLSEAQAQEYFQGFRDDCMGSPQGIEVMINETHNAILTSG
jgi:hypothetical protein